MREPVRLVHKELDPLAPTQHGVDLFAQLMLARHGDLWANEKHDSRSESLSTGGRKRVSKGSKASRRSRVATDLDAVKLGLRFPDRVTRRVLDVLLL